jgi:hypothetical protein
MAGIRPFFVNGSNAKIKLNGKTLAFCTDLSYSISILTQTPKVLGMYEGSSVEPLGYSVTGSFTVVRYVKDIGGAVGGKRPQGVAENDAGNGVGNWGSVWGGKLGDFLNRSGALDPSRFSNGTTFDIQVYQKVDTRGGNIQGAGDAGVVSGIASLLQGSTNSGPEGGSQANVDFVGIANIRNCRITQADFSISKRGAAMQRFNFTALYVDEDSFTADFSGQGQHFSG